MISVEEYICLEVAKAMAEAVPILSQVFGLAAPVKMSVGDKKKTLPFGFEVITKKNDFIVPDSKSTAIMWIERRSDAVMKHRSAHVHIMSSSFSVCVWYDADKMAGESAFALDAAIFGAIVKMQWSNTQLPSVRILADATTDAKGIVSKYDFNETEYQPFIERYGLLAVSFTVSYNMPTCALLATIKTEC